MYHTEAHVREIAEAYETSANYVIHRPARFRYTTPRGD
jgi:hypothetical protein